MFNDFNGYDEKSNKVKISIPPTLLISALSVMPDLYKTVSPELKNSGDLVYVLGKTQAEDGVPQVDTAANLLVYRAVEKAIDRELLASSISVAQGGLVIALAKACVGGMLGTEIEFPQDLLFSESQGRILVSVSPKNQNAFEKIVKKIPHMLLGKVSKDKKFTVTDSGKKIIQTNVDKLYAAYHSYSNKMRYGK